MDAVVLESVVADVDERHHIGARVVDLIEVVAIGDVVAENHAEVNAILVVVVWFVGLDVDDLVVENQVGVVSVVAAHALEVVVHVLNGVVVSDLERDAAGGIPAGRAHVQDESGQIAGEAVLVAYVTVGAAVNSIGAAGCTGVRTATVATLVVGAASVCSRALPVVRTGRLWSCIATLNRDAGTGGKERGGLDCGLRSQHQQWRAQQQYNQEKLNRTGQEAGIPSCHR